MTLSTPRIALTSDRSRVMLRRGAWSSDFPTADLPRWLRFYRDLRDRSKGRYREAYQPMVEALEKIEAKIREQEK